MDSIGEGESEYNYHSFEDANNTKFENMDATTNKSSEQLLNKNEWIERKMSHRGNIYTSDRSERVQESTNYSVDIKESEIKFNLSAEWRSFDKDQLEFNHDTEEYSTIDTNENDV